MSLTVLSVTTTTLSGMGREDHGEEPPSSGVPAADHEGGGNEGDGVDSGGVDAAATLAPEVAHVVPRPTGAVPTVVVEGYDRVELIGRGGFATVWKARQITMDRVVALKVMDHHLTDDEAVRRFALESSALVELSWNAHIVHVYDTGVTADGRPYLAMEYLPEGTLGDRVRAEGALAPDEVRRIGLALTDAVGAAHEAGVLHRDLKPDNVLLGRRDDPKLADFGIARIAGQSVTSTSSAQAFRGTILHAAPELLDGEQPTEATDIWSIGSTLYTLCTGHAPFARSAAGEDSVTAIIRRTLLDDPPSLPDSVPADLAATILSCLAKDPEDRPASVTDLGARLAGSAAAGATVGASGGSASGEGASGEGASGGAALGGRERGGRRPVLLAVASIAVVLAVGVSVWMFSRDDEPSEDATTTSVTEERPAAVSEEHLSDEEREEILARPEGVSDLRPLAATGRADTSASLRDRLNRFAASTTAPAVRNATVHQDLGGEELDFGTLPAQMDYSATNKSLNDECYKVYLEDQVVVGAAAAIWSDGVQGVLINSIQLESPEAALQYYWATALYHGLNEGQCSGWPDSGVAIRPEGLEVHRQEFAVQATPDELLTAIANDFEVGALKMVLAYQSTSLIGDTVVVASVGTSVVADPAELTRTIDQAISAFSG